MAGDYGDLMAKLVEAFEGEAEERLQELNKATLALEQASDPAEVADLIKLIFREAHTLKGTAGGLGLKSIERVGHSMETVFGLLRAGELTTSPDMFDAIYKSLDAIGELAKTAARSQPDSVDIAPLVDALNEIATRAGKPAPESQSNATSAEPAEPEVTEAPPQTPEPVIDSGTPAQSSDKVIESLPKKRKSRPPATVPTSPARAVEPAPTAPAPTAPEIVPVVEPPVVAEKSSAPRLLVPRKSTETISKPVQTQPKVSFESQAESMANAVAEEIAEKLARATPEPEEIEASAEVEIVATVEVPAPEPVKVKPEPVVSAPVAESKPVPLVTKPAPSSPETPVKPVAAPVSATTSVAATQTATRAPEESIRVSTNKLDILMEQVAELQTARINAEQRLTEVREMLERAENWDVEWRQIRSELWRMGLTNGSTAHHTQHDSDHGSASLGMDSRSIQNLSGFLDSNANHLRNSLLQLTGLVRNFDSDSRRMAQVMADLQDGVRRIRMLPISTVFETFPRMVRDTARAVEKDVNLVIKGGENEVDRTILEQVKAPLVHLLRNAVDHGLESPATRVAAGKSRQGTVNLSAAQRGANLQVEVSEDGGGIDVRKVRESAIRKGLLSPEASAAMSDQEALWLIFRPGFSTKATVTDLSGRGVGLDVVRENVEGLGGMIDVKSEIGEGTTFTLTLPMSVATTLVMIVECGRRRFALPVTNVLRIMQVDPSKVGQLRGRAAIDFEGRPIALTHLADALGQGDGQVSLKAGEPVQALIVGSAEKRYAFLVDGVLGAQEVVVKSLLPPLDRVRRVAGATILGTGEVVMVVNVADLIRSSSLANFGVTMGRTGAVADMARKEQKSEEPPLVLCVDDSFTTRTLIKSIVEAAGYRTEQAIDGLDAWTKLQTEPIRLVVTDVNMPRMDGFELTRTIRNDSRTKDLPVVLVTSLDSPEERAEGVKAGADAHIVKGALRQEDLLETIKRLL